MKKILATALAGLMLCVAAPVPQAQASSVAALNRKGVILVSRDAWHASLPPTAYLGHAGIVYSKDNVIEAIAKGVSFGSNDWDRSRTRMTAVTVRGTSAAQDAGAADYARAQIGKPYNTSFYKTYLRSKFYCSQLVWAAYKDKYGIDLDTYAWGNAIAPTELISSSRTYTVYSKG